MTEWETSTNKVEVMDNADTALQKLEDDYFLGETDDLIMCWGVDTKGSMELEIQGCDTFVIYKKNGRNYRPSDADDEEVTEEFLQKLQKLIVEDFIIHSVIHNGKFPMTAFFYVVPAEERENIIYGEFPTSSAEFTAEEVNSEDLCVKCGFPIGEGVRDDGWEYCPHCGDMLNILKYKRRI